MLRFSSQPMSQNAMRVRCADLFDVLFAKYRIDNCTECGKLYHMDHLLGLNVACSNSLILYTCHYSQLAVPGKERLDLLGFASQCLFSESRTKPSINCIEPRR